MEQYIIDVLKNIEKRSQLEKSHRINVPSEDRMLTITKETGQFFNIILQCKNAKNILEIGTSVGYSTIWCAEAIMNNNGKIITIEKNQNKIKLAKKNFEDARLSEFIDIINGNALERLTELNKKYKEYFDFVLIDADKENCINYFDLILPMLKVGGVITTDNILFPEKYRKDMQIFIKHIKNTPNVKTVTIPIGYGEELTVKIKN